MKLELKAKTQEVDNEIQDLDMLVNDGEFCLHICHRVWGLLKCPVWGLDWRKHPFLIAKLL